MASITRRDGKKGITYQLTAFVGTKPDGTPLRKFKSWHPPKGMAPSRMEKAAMLEAEKFEQSFKLGYQLDNKQTFSQYAEYVIKEKERGGLKVRTAERYRELLPRINQAIGHLKLIDIRPQHLNMFYENLGEAGIRIGADTAVAKMDLAKWLKDNKLSRSKIAAKAGISASTVGIAVSGEKISIKKAAAIAAAMDLKLERAFKVEKNMEPLSNKTILEHHRLISSILEQAEKEMLVPYNAAAKATPPKATRNAPEVLEPEEVADMLAALAEEPLKWRLFTELLLATSCRRGEIAGLKWEKIDFQNRLVKIDSQLICTKQDGITESSTKTEDSRYIKIPEETMELLKEQKREQLLLQQLNGDRWIETGYVFTRDNGEPMNPESITGWLSDFSKRHGLRHIHPHMLRHTGASYYIANGIDIATVSRQLGHASVTTTHQFYIHAIEENRAKTADCMADLMYSRTRARTGEGG